MPENPAEIRSLTSVLLARYQFLRQAGLTFGGARDMYETLGYSRILTNTMYRDTYLRGGIAKRIVEAYPKATWRGGVDLQEDEDPDVSTPFEMAWEELQQKFQLWPKLQRVDILAGLGSFSVLLIGAPGELNEELPKGSPDRLLYFTPFAGGGGPAMSQGGGQTAAGPTSAGYVDATIMEFVSDTKDPRFGLPLTYQLRRLDVTSADFLKPVHWSRVLHVAEGLLDNEVYGQPTLENVYNLLEDLEKVTGGGAEAFWLRANQGMNLNLDKDMTLGTEAAAKLVDEVEEYRNNISRILKTKGMDVNMLGSDVANFSNPADAILTQIAGSKGIPKRILMGSEMGQLASGQDQDNWSSQVQDRRTAYAGPNIVRPFVDRLIKYGYLPKPSKYDVVWPTVEELTEIEKAQGVTAWSGAKTADGKGVFTTSEIRQKWYRMEPLTPEQVAEMTPPAPPAPEMPAGAPQADAGAKIDPKTGKPAEPKTAEAGDLLLALEQAIVTGDTDTIDEICGVRHAANPEGINQYTDVAEGYHVIEHKADGSVQQYGVFKTKKESHAAGMKLRRDGHSSTYVHHSDDIKKFGIRVAYAVPQEQVDA